MHSESIVISIDKLRMRACHGVFEQERLIGNDYEISVSLSYPPALDATRSDSLDRTVNYAEIVEVVKAVMATPSKLLEHVCGRLKEALIERFPACDGGHIKVVKLLPPIPGVQLDGAAVTLTW